MILLAGTSVMLVFAMLQKPEPVQTPMPVVSTMVAPPEALPAPTIAVPEPVEAEPAPTVKRTKKKGPSLEEVAPPEVTVTTPAIEAPKEPEKPAAAPAASDTDEKKKKGLFGKKKDR
jgi:hypothetical protein